MNIGLSLFLVVDTLNGFVDADGFIRQRDIFHLQAAEFADAHAGKKRNKNAGSFSIQVHVDALNKILLLVLGERDRLLDAKLFRVLYQVPVE